MRGLRLLLLFTALGPMACKTRRPTIELDERVPLTEGGLKSAQQDSAASAFLKISDLSLPVDALPYSRMHVELIPQNIPADAQLKAIVNNNYNRTMKIPILPGLKYELIVKAYQGGAEVYSNIYCHNSRYFTSKAGSNIYTVPVCAVPKVDNAKPVKSDNTEMMETPSMPGG